MPIIDGVYYNEDSTTSGNAYNKRTLKRMKLVYKDTSINFAINPEDYTQSEPNKSSITQTKGGAWIDAWGAGIVEITLKGTTGVKGSGTSIDTGYQRWKELRGLIREVYEEVTDGEEIDDDGLIRFYNFTDNEFWYCYPAQGGIELYRSKSRPHIYQYTINLWGIRRIGQPSTSSGIIGNPTKTGGGGSGSSSVTSKNVSVTALAGSSKATRNTLRNTEVDNVTVTNTKTKSTLGLQEDCLEYLTELEPLIGGKSGKISPVTGFQCTQGITMQSSGTISNVTAFTGQDLSDEINDLMLSEVKYISKASVETYTLYTNIKNYSPSVLSPAYSLVVGLTPTERVVQAVSNSVAYDSTIYELLVSLQAKSVLSKTEVNHIKVIMLESMMVYQELYKMYNATEELSTTLTMTNMQTLIDNIRAMIMYFTLNTDSSDNYQRMDINSELRSLEKIMTQIRTDIVDYL